MREASPKEAKFRETKFNSTSSHFFRFVSSSLWENCHWTFFTLIPIIILNIVSLHLFLITFTAPGFLSEEILYFFWQTDRGTDRRFFLVFQKFFKTVNWNLFKHHLHSLTFYLTFHIFGFFFNSPNWKFYFDFLFNKQSAFVGISPKYFTLTWRWWRVNF